MSEALQNTVQVLLYKNRTGAIVEHRLKWDENRHSWLYDFRVKKRGKVTIGPHKERFVCLKEAPENYNPLCSHAQLCDATQEEVYDWLRQEITDDMSSQRCVRHW